MMEAFGAKGFFVEDPKDLKDALDELPSLASLRVFRVNCNPTLFKISPR